MLITIFGITARDTLLFKKGEGMGEISLFLFY